ncbi:hypothetical protein ACQY0O_005332 [Thecaphora frezii]
MADASEPSYLIVGAGAYGSSLALTLARLGHRRVTVLDRSADGYAAADSASNDINKVIRSDYGDDHYCALAKEAISRWRSDPVHSPYYHEVGLVLNSYSAALADKCLPIKPDARDYVDHGVSNGMRPDHAGLEYGPQGRPLPLPPWKMEDDARASAAFPPHTWAQRGPALRGFGELQVGYANPRAGWAEANNATRASLAEAQRLGVSVVPDACVTELLFEPNAPPQTGKKVVRGVRTARGDEYTATYVVLAAGSWSRLLLDTLYPSSSINRVAPASPSAQCVITLQLSPEVAAQFAGAPCIFNIETGFYLFEPNANGQLKCAIHDAAGYQNPAPQLAGGRTYPTFEAGHADSAHPAAPASLSKSAAHRFVPEDKTEAMLEQLFTYYPILRSTPRERISTRICWYSDSHDENLVIDWHPDLERLLIATGDSGHAFKFLPVLGRLLAARLGVEGVPKLTEYQQRVFSIKHHTALAKKIAEGHEVSLAATLKHKKNAVVSAFDEAQEFQNAKAKL